MAKKRQSKGNHDNLLPDLVLLPEVDRKLKETDGPVEVIFGVNEGFSAEDVRTHLEGLGVDCGPKDIHTDRFVFGTISGDKQAQQIENSFKDVVSEKRCIGRVWLDKPMTSCVDESQTTINAPAARTLFERHGEEIHWAVLDTGIDIKHNDLKKNCSSQRRHDFTGEGLAEVALHGTHVAGIIVTVAPKIVLYDYKVLGKKGGKSSWIIRAMHHIRQRNFDAGRIIIHGVNLSLGGPVPVPSYGAGWSPECQEANRLADSGVVVCTAAGNHGHKTLATLPGGQLQIYESFVDLGITDPGNAEKVITVGSSHRTRPHSYGPSYFSSKGPTGDGRLKPDCLAPGEKITAAKADKKFKNLVTTMSGTSMACPHVSGAIALFLSAKPEFKGRSAEVKRILLESCTDLARDKYFQGAGLVDVLRMIQKV